MTGKLGLYVYSFSLNKALSSSEVTSLRSLEGKLKIFFQILSYLWGLDSLFIVHSRCWRGNRVLTPRLRNTDHLLCDDHYPLFKNLYFTYSVIA